MTIKELKEDLNKLSSEYDNFRVEFSNKWDSFNKHSGYLFRIDTPIVGSIMDDTAKEYLFLGKEAMECFVKNIQAAVSINGNKGKDSKKARNRKRK